ncbi:hypothetical protein CATRI_07860 [Corynebacterium atrinae]|uniref:AMIN-like domain-containing (lipo)protein n=1 Tax=Corynebacterium atrinae TaxID=1336740 RepID=UPI0025B5C305|nr:hypothetical protein [Corynebacterium atrinae]WJY63644.1 hypothetical protein CATRI_07860 [Corynebacterium atrinae]
MKFPQYVKPLAIVAIVSLTLTACSGATEETTPPEVANSESKTSVIPAITSELGPIPPGQTNRADRWRDPSPNSELMVTGVTLEDHDDYEALIIQLSGLGKPGWATYYTSEPTQQGSGNPVDYVGNAALQLTIIGTPYPTGTDRDAEMLPHGDYPGGSVVRSINFTSVFEAQSEFVIGLDEQVSYNLKYDPDLNQVVAEFVKG